MPIANDSLLARLPEADRQAVIQSRQTSAPAKQSPQSALADIQSNPPPKPAAAAQFGPADQQAIHEHRVVAHHTDQATLAQQALDETRPEFDDFATLPPAMARAEFDVALAAFNADPAVLELRELAAYEAPEPAAPSAPEPATDLTTLAQQAVNDIHAMALPDTTDIIGLSGDPVFNAIYTDRVVEFNAQRADAAQAALDALRPSPEALQTMHPTQAQYALDEFNANPYVAELNRIVGEAQAAPETVPAYLRNDAAGASSSNAEALTNPEVTEALSALGIDIGPDATPATLAAGRELLDALPADLLGVAINPGMTVSFETAAGGINTPGFFKPGAGVELTLGAEIEFGDVQTGVDFAQHQRFEATVSAQVDGSVSYGGSRSRWQRLFGQLDRLSPGATELLGESTVLNRIFRGTSTPVSASYSHFAGAQLSYEAIVTPEQGALLADGDLTALPNPYDPLNMAEGTGVLIEGSTLVGSSFELTGKIKGPVRAIASGSTTNLDGYGFSVTRIEGNVVEVQSGPLEAVEHDLYFGLGSKNFNVGLGSNREITTHDVQVAHIDLGTEEGQQAYQAFISSGHVPDWQPPGVLAAGTTSIYDSQSDLGVRANAGGLSIEFEAGSHEGNTRWTVWQDGTRGVVSQDVTNDWHTAIVEATLDTNDQPIDPEFTLVLADLEGPGSALFARAIGSDPNIEFDENQHVQLEFSGEELMAIRQRVRDEFSTNENGRGILERLDNDPTNTYSLRQEIAAADSPEAVWQIISNERDVARIAFIFESLHTATGEPLPGTVSVQEAS